MNPIESNQSLFQNIPVVGFFPKAVNPSEDMLPIKDEVSGDWFAFMAKYPKQADVLIKNSTHRGVARSLSGQMKSIMKCDVAPKEPIKDFIYKAALHMTIDYLKPYIWVEPKLKFCDAVFNFSASPGLPYILHGINSKGDAFKSLVFINRMGDPEGNIPLYKCFQKIELLPEQDIIQENKARTIFNGPLDSLCEAAELFDEQNDLLIANAGKIYSCYGLNKWQGGFHNVIKKLELHNFRYEGDVSGYDRVAFLWVVYLIRFACMKLTPRQHARFWWVAYFATCSFSTLPNGLIVQFLTGNRSGARNTASDNTILHIFIIFYTHIYIFWDKFLDLPTLSQILDNLEAMIYSDDVLNSVNLEFFGVSSDEYLQYLTKCYAMFGMVRKPKTIKWSFGPGRLDSLHSFLGSNTFYHEFYNMYYPIPMVGKICSSAIYTVNSKPIEHTFHRIMALITLTVFVEDIHLSLISYLKYLLITHSDRIIPSLRNFATEFLSGCDDRCYFVNHYFGLESNVKSFQQESFFLLPHGWQEVERNFNVGSDSK